jgi:hypothetical protein
LFNPKKIAVEGRPGGRSGFAGGIKIRIRLRRDQRLQAVG